MLPFTGNHTKFVAKCAALAKEWVEAIQRVIAEERERERRDVSEGIDGKSVLPLREGEGWEN